MSTVSLVLALVALLASPVAPQPHGAGPAGRHELAASSSAAQMGTQDGFDEYTTLTASFRITIRIGPKVTMAMSTMTTLDRGRPVNRHLEVHVLDKTTGADMNRSVPRVVITDQQTTASRELSNLTACRTARHRETAPHFGDNVYLPDGVYTVTVTVGTDTATFKSVTVKT